MIDDDDEDGSDTAATALATAATATATTTTTTTPATTTTTTTTRANDIIECRPVSHFRFHGRLVRLASTGSACARGDESDTVHLGEGASDSRAGLSG